MFKLRDYQADAHQGIVEAFRKEQKCLLVMATGSGKSKTAISFVEKYQEHYIFILVVRTRDLVSQLEQDLVEFSLDYGVFMAGHEKYSPKKEIQLCSIDTVHSREVYPHRWAYKDVVVIIDEADQSKSEGYQQLIDVYCKRNEVRKPQWFDFSRPFRNAFLLGMTATPYNGLPHFDTYIEPITSIDLKEKGVLVEYDYKVPSTKFKLEEVEIRGGEFSAKSLDQKLNTDFMIEQSFKAWLQFGDNRQTLVFCINQDHAKNFCSYINRYYNKDVAMFVDSNTPSHERSKVYDLFRNGQLRFLLNVRLITRGTNIIEIGTILDCASTMSVNHHIQKIGRGSRANPIYKDCILIDVARNLEINGHFYQKREIDLNAEVKRSKADLFDLKMRSCPKCFIPEETQNFIKNKCPNCGFVLAPLPIKKISKKKQEQLFMENATELQIEQRQMIKDFKKILWKKEHLSKLGKKSARDAAIYSMLDKYGVEKVTALRISLNLQQRQVDAWKAVNEYVPLGGLNI